MPSVLTILKPCIQIPSQHKLYENRFIAKVYLELKKRHVLLIRTNST